MVGIAVSIFGFETFWASFLFHVADDQCVVKIFWDFVNTYLV